MANPSLSSANALRCVSIIFFCIIAGNNCIAQHAAFTPSVTSGCFPLTVKFTDSSTGTITGWAWNFGNGNSSSLQSPSAVYAAPGIYSVTLTVSNSSQSDTKTGYITVYDSPAVDFSFDHTSGCTPLSVIFKDQTSNASGAITNWLWVFGDGATSTDANPTHVFTSPGNPSISLKVRNEHNCERTKVSSGINVQGPTAAFSANNTLVCQVPATIKFTNESAGTGNLTYDWNFGDGATDTAPSPSHTFTKPGSYAVVLKALDPAGCESTHSTTINAGSEGGLNFIPSATKICLGKAITFVIQTNSPADSWNWNFGNGTSSNDSNPSITYTTPGTYTVTLNAKLQGNTCNSIVTKTIEVAAAPTLNFTYRADCNYKVTLTNTSIGASRIEWYVRETLYSTAQSFTFDFKFPGDQAVTLVAYNSFNCSESLQKTVSIPIKPIAAFNPNLEQDCSGPSLSGCAPFTLQLSDQSISQSNWTSLWNFGDGRTSTAKNPAHTYTNKGNYTVTLTITNAAGCTASTSAKVTVSNVKPVAKFKIDHSSVCSRADVIFTDESRNGTFSCWDFGDGYTTVGPLVAHRYDKPGMYTVSLTSKNGGCTDTLVMPNAIEVRDPYVDFLVEKNCDDPYTVKLKNLSTNYETLQWNFGDGNSTTANVTSYRYQSIGDYTIHLKCANTTTFCEVETITTVSIQDVKADFEIDNHKPCKGSPVVFTDKSTSAAQWTWSFGNNTFSTQQSPTTTFYKEGDYNVILYAFDKDGCSDQKTLPIKVLDIEGNFNFDASSTCDALTVHFHDQSHATPSLASWQWDFGDGETSTETNPQHIYHTLNTYPVTLTLTNAEGTCSFVRRDAVLFKNPIPDFSISKPASCIGEKITITNTSAYATAFTWNFGDGRTSHGLNEQITYSFTGNYTLSLTAVDDYGCQKTVTKPDVISITKPVASFAAFEIYGACPPLTTSFQNKSTGNVKKWQWNFGDGHSSVLSDPANTYLKPGAFDVNLMVTDANGCTDITSTKELVHVGGPSGTFKSDFSGNACLNKTVAFTATTKNTAIHRWDFGDGTVEDKTVMQASHDYLSVGQFVTALVLIDEQGCKVVADGNVRIVVNDTTKIDFAYLPTCIFEGDHFVLQASPADDGITWTWQINAQAAGNGSSLTTSLDVAGKYPVKLLAVNKYGCVSTVYDTIPVQGVITYIPNVFTPNNDGYNNFFQMKDLEKSRWDIKVYNRWGDPVYAQDNYAGNWDGDGVAAGVYYYIVRNSFCGDKTYKGNVMIIR
jgi:gliding motility-associated-like protein